VLVGDLDCSGDLTPAISLEDGAQLDLAGFTLTGGESTGVTCLGDCTIVGGGGTITGAQLAGVAAAFADVVVSDVSISGNGDSGIAAWLKGEVTATNVTTNDNGWGGNGGGGIEARVLVATGCTATGNYRSGFYGEKDVTVSGSTSSGNRRGVYGHRRIVVNNSTVTNNEHGIYAYKRVEIAGSVVTDNPSGGAWSDRKLVISSSTFSDNSSDPYCLTVPGWLCADIVSLRRPLVNVVSCETSASFNYRDDSIGTWGVCAND